MRAHCSLPENCEERMRAVGIDIGGTGVRGALVENGRIGPVIAEPLRARTLAALVDATARVVAAVGGAERVGVGVPGFVRGGVVLGSPNFPDLVHADVRAALAAGLPGVEVHVENDANCAAWGAWVAAGARGDLVLLTLGTGVGGGIVTDGRLLVGAGGTGAEVGHLYAGGDAPCGCGGRGCLETWCSTVGLVRLARERGLEADDGRVVVDRARQGDPVARAVVDAAGAALGRGLITLVNLFNPDRVELHGGLAAAADLWGPVAEGALRAHGVPPSVQRAQVVWGGRAEEFAILGAAELGR